MRTALLLLALVALPARAELPSRPTVAFALEAIRDRALQSPPLDRIAVEGLRGLTALDPALGAAQDGHGRLRLTNRDRNLASFAEPPAGDATGWSVVIEQASRVAAGASSTIAKADQDRLTEAVIDGFLSKLDIFSHYAGPAETRERRAVRSGFGGIGVRYELVADGIALTEVLADSPAAQARLRVGDHVLAIDDTRLAGLEIETIVQKLRGAVASPVRLTLWRDGASQTVTLRRSLILAPSVTMTLEDGVAVLAVSAFRENTAALAVEALRKARAAPGFKGVVLDLRGNPGGLLDQAIALADQFIEQGRILETRGRHPAAAQSQEARAGDIGEKMALVALIDGNTASAAEILAADLQDSGRAVLVGSNSFGKGAIQTVLDLPNQGEMTLTWSRFYAPSGYALHGLGLLPNICTAPPVKGGGDVSLAGGHAAPRSLFSAWRSAGADDRAQRSRLRGHCPAGDHGEDRADLAIARQLLSDRALYDRALAVGLPMATASLRTPAGVNPLR